MAVFVGHETSLVGFSNAYSVFTDRKAGWYGSTYMDVYISKWG